jgi:hypothetical protein
VEDTPGPGPGPEPVAGQSLADLVGPCYTTVGVCRLLGVSRQTISEMATGLQILRLRTSDGVFLSPRLQFTDTGETVPGLHQVLVELSRGVDDPWSWAQWLAAEVDGRPSAVDRLRAGHVEEVLVDARHTADAWAS